MPWQNKTLSVWLKKTWGLWTPVMIQEAGFQVRTSVLVQQGRFRNEVCQNQGHLVAMTFLLPFSRWHRTRWQWMHTGREEFIRQHPYIPVNLSCIRKDPEQALFMRSTCVDKYLGHMQRGFQQSWSNHENITFPGRIIIHTLVSYCGCYTQVAWSGSNTARILCSLVLISCCNHGVLYWPPALVSENCPQLNPRRRSQCHRSCWETTKFSNTQHRLLTHDVLNQSLCGANWKRELFEVPWHTEYFTGNEKKLFSVGAQRALLP